MTPVEFNAWLAGSHRRPLVMGILNLTPDSFSDGGQHLDVDTAVQSALAMFRAGASIIDVGGESTRPGSESVPADEQIRRVEAVIREIRKAADCVVSIDTGQSSVATVAVEAGALLVNDVYGGLDDPAMFPCVASLGVPIVLGHLRGRPRDMMGNAHYTVVVSEVRAFLIERIAAAEANGIARSHVLVDPGIGFAKNPVHDLQILNQLGVFKSLGLPLVVGVSRKKFIGTITGQSAPADRVFGTAAAVAWSVANGADIVRVHDVEAMSQVVRMIEAIQTETAQPPAPI